MSLDCLAGKVLQLKDDETGVEIQQSIEVGFSGFASRLDCSFRGALPPPRTSMCEPNSPTSCGTSFVKCRSEQLYGPGVPITDFTPCYEPTAPGPVPQTISGIAFMSSLRVDRQVLPTQDPAPCFALFDIDGSQPRSSDLILTGACCQQEPQRFKSITS